MKQLDLNYASRIGFIIAVLLGLFGCGGKTTPPGASFISGGFTEPDGFGGSFVVLQWPDGLNVVLVDDVEGEHESSGSSSTEDPVWRGQGASRAADGRQVNWRVESTNGQTGTFFIDEQAYDLEHGTLFLIRTGGGQTDVTQHQLALAGSCSDYDECHRTLLNEPAVAQFVQETRSQ